MTPERIAEIKDHLSRAVDPRGPLVDQFSFEKASIKYIPDLIDALREAQERVKVLEGALTAARDDLNIRAVKGVVAVGISVWNQITAALDTRS